MPADWAPRSLAEAYQHPLIRVLLPVLAAPVVEEILFRGVLFVGLREGLGERAAILISALVFPFVHSDYASGATFAGGAALAWIYQRTGLLSASILAHAVLNALNVWAPPG